MPEWVFIILTAVATVVAAGAVAAIGAFLSALRKAEGRIWRLEQWREDNETWRDSVREQLQGQRLNMREHNDAIQKQYESLDRKIDDMMKDLHQLIGRMDSGGNR